MAGGWAISGTRAFLAACVEIVESPALHPAFRVKIGFLSESPADEAALHILVEALLKRPVEVMQPPLRARGWPHVLQVLPAVLHHLQFQTDADALIAVVDSDDTPLHDADHEDPNRFHPLCRLCQLELAVRRTIKRWKLPPGRAPLRVATGLAVPAVEAWYLCGVDPEVGEEGWRSGRSNYDRRELKRRTYHTPRPSLPLETRRAMEEARRLAADLRLLENAFPLGFGNLAREVRPWRTVFAATGGAING